MSKIHEALKKAERESGNPSGDVSGYQLPNQEVIDSDQGTGQADDVGRSAENGQDSVVPLPVAAPGGSADTDPALPFNKLRAYRLETHNFLVAEHAPKSLAAEQFRTLRTRIQRLSSESPRKLLLVTSPGPGEGKTLVSANLAMSLAQEMDSRVLLVGCDLRRPSVQNFLGLTNEGQPGLHEYLVGQVSLDKAIWRFGGSSLHVLTAGTIPDNPCELLGSRRMERTLRYLAGQFDKVVLDAPPMNPVADPAILIPMVDGVLVVARYGQTGRAGLNRALENIPAEKILGMVFNAAEMRFSGYYYSYEYAEE